MKITKIHIKNFRLLSDIEINLENQTTVIVGRNNSGKTSFSEIMRRLVLNTNPSFQIEDFSCEAFDSFFTALKAYNDKLALEEIRDKIPYIELQITIRYDPESPIGLLSNLIVNLDTSCNDVLIVIRYELKDGAINDFFNGMEYAENEKDLHDKNLQVFRDRIPKYFCIKILSQDPSDKENCKSITHIELQSIIKIDFINAQRGLDDNTTNQTDILSKVLENLFATATLPTNSGEDQVIAKSLIEAVRDIQEMIDADFNTKLKLLLPTLESFGYPGLIGQELETITTLNIKKLLSDNTKVTYVGHNGIRLPEAYNGLGIRNLIFILFQIVKFHKEFLTKEIIPCVHIVFIEEPEAHLHPQMQEVFIRQLSKIMDQLNNHREIKWPAQFVVSTHSSHIANEAGFESIRYFLSITDGEIKENRKSKVKDLREGLTGTPEEDRNFLRQYLTLTRCDLFFADKAILIEGTGERLLLPVMIRELESQRSDLPTLSSQYLTILEVGGAYAHIFFKLLDFLELSCLIITDIDSVDASKGEACAINQGHTTSNACIKKWFSDNQIAISKLLNTTDTEKIHGKRRIAYQIPETIDGPCGRTFEDAFILANQTLFDISGSTVVEKENYSMDYVKKIKKSEFALKYAIFHTHWSIPKYILDGLVWLAQLDYPISIPT